MKEKVSFLNNEKGSTLVVAVVFLLLLTMIGSFATTTSTIEVLISGNDKINKMVFYAADSGIDYVAVNPALYGVNNITEGTPLSFPNYSLSNRLQVNGTVAYVGKSQLPPGSGFSAGKVFAINYTITSTGTAPNKGTNTVAAGFYRIGL